MPWFKVDDGLPSHRKVLALPRGQRRLAAMGAWTLCGAWASKNLTEGRVPAAVVEEYAIPGRVVADLLDVGLWRRVDNGYVMHDFLDYNPTAERVREEREAAAERQRRAREKARARRAEEEASRDRHTVTHALVTRGVTDPVTVPPTRPDPTRPVVSSSVEEESEVELRARLLREDPAGDVQRAAARALARWSA